MRAVNTGQAEGPAEGCVANFLVPRLGQLGPHYFKRRWRLEERTEAGARGDPTWRSGHRLLPVTTIDRAGRLAPP